MDQVSKNCSGAPWFQHSDQSVRNTLTEKYLLFAECRVPCVFPYCRLVVCNRAHEEVPLNSMVPNFEVPVFEGKKSFFKILQTSIRHLGKVSINRGRTSGGARATPQTSSNF